MTAVKDLTREQAALLAARLIDQVGMDAVAPHLPVRALTPPRPGTALLACHCGRVLDARDMHRQRSRHPGAPPIPRITCKDCAT